MIKWLLLGGAILLEVSASLSLKAALLHPGWYVLVVVGYAGAFLMLIAVLRAGMPIGVAYGIWGALGVAVTAVFSTLIFGEPLTVLMIFGILLVIAGVLCVELGSHIGPVRDEPISASEGAA
ncbi:DMT family transporter [Naasia lichenicola]|uniref:QacE family quaternary ammonium compound efflux SMR transporter n=1 Tax=Naasia lichenicola TaxID=2565933 RepID=A0A4S4FIX9_9MICO|nr:SMR family transporter [Naasia lichenicola]THG29802.1 QacE family quaternary ammonium compound efflux SMR transporter [Naasia lichenicola]